MTQFKSEWWPKIVKNHGLPPLSEVEVALLIELSEGLSDAQIVQGSKYSHEASIRGKFSKLVKTLGLTPTLGSAGRHVRSANRQALKAWAEENQDTLYTVLQHMTPDDGENDCTVEACNEMWR